MYGVEDSGQGASETAADTVPGDLFSEIRERQSVARVEDAEKSRDLDVNSLQKPSAEASATLSKVILLYSDGTFSEFHK